MLFAKGYIFNEWIRFRRKIDGGGGGGDEAAARYTFGARYIFGEGRAYTNFNFWA